MKVVIFAGGYGSRLTEETTLRPKPMVEIGGRPIIWHIMKTYAYHGFDEFVVLAGYKAEIIKSYFLDYASINSDFTVNLASGEITWKRASTENWKVTVLDTGLNTMTGGRLKRAREFIGQQRFLLTYGDGVSNIDIANAIETHDENRNWVTLTAVTQPGRYGALRLSDDTSKVRAFREKAAGDGGLVNGGYFVCEPDVFDLIDDELDSLGRAANGSAHRKGQARHILAQRLLAEHGLPTRQDRVGEGMGDRKRSLESLDLKI